jgi:hypothetical protein
MKPTHLWKYNPNIVLRPGTRNVIAQVLAPISEELRPGHQRNVGDISETHLLRGFEEMVG